VSASLFRGFYFSRVRIVGAHDRPVPPRGGRLTVSSHRNGATDGYIVLKAFPGVQGLVSIQLLQHPLRRWLFDGIALVRDKDRKRGGIQRATFAHRADAGCAQLRAVGDLVIFPEGSSLWGFQPLTYQRGAPVSCKPCSKKTSARKWVDGFALSGTRQFRSPVEALPGRSVEIPARVGGESVREWERRIHQSIYEPVGLWLAGLQIRLCGPYLRRVLAHSTTMDPQIARNLSSHSQIFASTTKARQAPRTH
jgi:hypothetical protein